MQCTLTVCAAHGEIVRRAIFANELPTATDDMGASCASVNKCIFVNNHPNAATDDGEKKTIQNAFSRLKVFDYQKTNDFPTATHDSV